MKLITKIVGVTLGLAMAVGVGVGVAANSRKAVGLNAADASITYSTGSYSNETITWSCNGVLSVLQERNGNGNTAPSSSYVSGPRWYSGNKITFTPSDGITITEMNFTANTENYANVLKNSTWSDGTAASNGTAVTWTGSASSAFTVIMSGQCRLSTSMSITFSGGELPTFGDLDHLKITTAATKNDYGVGETFSSSGLVLTGYDAANEAAANTESYSSGYSTDYDGHTFVAGDIGEQTVTVSYGGKQIDYPIYVSDILLSTSNKPYTSTSNSNTETESVTLSGIRYDSYAAYIYNSYLSFNKNQSGAYLGNHTAFAKNIEKIVVNYNSGGSSLFTMYEGTSALAESAEIEASASGTGRITYTFSDEYQFFKFKLTTTGTYCNINGIAIYLGSNHVDAEVDTVVADIKSGTYYAGSTLSASDFDVIVSWTAGKADTYPTDGFTWTVNGVLNGELEDGDNTVVLTYEGVDSDPFIVEATTIHATAVSVTESTATLSVGDTLALHGSVTPANAVETISWSSDAEEVATVDENGEVTAVAAGSATITATAGSYSDTCEITVVATNTLTLDVDDISDGGVTSTAGVQTFINNGLKIEISNGLADGNVRVYKNATITFTAARILSIEFTCTASGTAQYGPGCFSEQSGYSYLGTIGTWKGDETSVGFTASSNQVRFTQVVIKYLPNQNFTYHNVSFNSLGGGSFDAERILHGGLINSLPQPTKAKDSVNQKKYEFDGWYYNVDPANPNYAEGIEFTTSTPVTSDLVLVAKYNETNYYIVSFESNGGTEIDSIEVDSGDTIDAPVDPVKAADATYSYEFDGWYTNVGLTSAFSFSTPITSNMTLYAKYTAEAINNPAVYLSSSTSVATIHGSESHNVQSGVDSLVFADSGLANETVISDLMIGQVTLDGQQGSHNSSVPKYYTNGHNMRVYVGNTFTLEAAHNITKVEFTFTSGYASGLTVSTGSLADGVWTGDEDSITFTNSNSGSTQVRIEEISVTYGKETLSVNNVALRFGASIAKADWDAINNNLEHPDWEITDYGVMFLKEATLNSYGKATVKAAFEDSMPVTIKHKGDGEAPYLDGDNYLFTIKVSIPASYYGDVICAVPFIKVNDTYYFLEEKHESVNSLATYYRANGGSTLSNDALDYLKTAH